MNRDQVMAELVVLAEELCDPHRHTERVEEWDRNRNRKVRAYVTTQDGLLRQLREVASEGLKVGETVGSGGKPKSKPPGVFEALNRHVYIAVESGRWCVSVGIDPRMTPEESIRGLVGKAPNLSDEQMGQLLKEMRFWRAQAASATGWERPPYCPPVPCPSCSRLGTLKINLLAQSGYCTNQDRTMLGELICGATWPSGSLVEGSSLVTYVRALTEGMCAA